MLQLTLQLDSPIPLEAEAIAPDRLQGLSQDEIRRLELRHGNRTIPLGDVFAVSGEADGTIEMIGDYRRVKGLGQGMSSGRLQIRGSVGLHCGAQMTGGEIVVEGNAGDWLGAEMRGGRIRIQGNAGNLVGAAYRGGLKGMQGGEILILGNAGHEVGSCQRRGLIAIAGDAGDFAGISMIAGSIFVFGYVGMGCGAGMKRGTIFLARRWRDPVVSFRAHCDYQPPFLAIYLKHLQSLGFPLPPLEGLQFVRRYTGDHLSLGHGEILQALPG